MDSKLYLAFTKAYLSNTLDHDDESAIDNQNIQNDDNDIALTIFNSIDIL